MENSKMFKHLHIFHDYGSIDKKYIEDFEKQYNICLPKTYKEFILRHNGGSFEEDTFDFIKKSGEDGIRSCFFYSFGNEDASKGENIITYNKGIQDPNYYGVKGLIGFASTAEGDTVCFDYRDEPKTCEPKIALLVHDEYETDSDGYEHMKVEYIANSFDEFLDMLYEFNDDDIEYE